MQILSRIKKHKIDKICVIGNKIADPCLGVIEIIEELFTHKSYTTVIEMFAGSAAYSKVCSNYSNCKVKAYDISKLKKYLIVIRTLSFLNVI